MLIDNIEVVEENAEEQQPVDVQEEDYSDVGNKQSEPAVEDAYDSIEEKTARLPLFSSIESSTSPTEGLDCSLPSFEKSSS